MTKSTKSDPLQNLNSNTDLEETVANLKRTVTSLQGGLNELRAKLESLEDASPTAQPEESSPTRTFEEKLWEAIMAGAISRLFDPTQIWNLSNTEHVMSHISKALKIAEEVSSRIVAHKKHIANEAPDPLKNLISED